MTNTNSTPPGWYRASGDPDQTQRYWNGAEWVGSPQPLPGTATSAFGPPPAGGVGGTPDGYQPYRTTPSGVVPAEYIPRVIAYLIDYALVLLPLVLVGAVTVFVATASGALGAAIGIAGGIAVIGFAIWNVFVRQGSTGQTIGKSQQNIQLIKDETGRPPGGGMTFVRYLVAGLLSNISCGVYGILDILWPLWDADKKRLTDKILKMSVIRA